jgi:predicted DNA-binding ribbon-helix-helix protein
VRLAGLTSAWGNAVKSAVIKRSIVIGGHKTSVSLEDAFWSGLKRIATERQQTLSELVAAIDTARQHGNLSTAIRLFVLDCYRGEALAAEADDVARQNGHLAGALATA